MADGTGHEMPEPDFSGDVTARMTYEGEQKVMPPEFGGWRTTCRVCHEAEKSGKAASVALLAILGVNEPEGIAQRILGTLTTYNHTTGTFTGGIAAVAHSTATGKPWGHVTGDDRAVIEAAYAEEMRRVIPDTSSRGGCGMCGRATQVGQWWEGPDSLRWPDGSPTSLCNGCYLVWEKRDCPSDIIEIRKCGIEAASGYPVSLGVGIPDELRLFAESKAADKIGTDEPWTYSAEMTVYIESRWTSHPEYAPAERVAEFEARRTASAEAYWNARADERRQVEAQAW